MQQNNGARAWALGIVALTAATQFMLWWLCWDDGTFGRNRPGTRVIRDMFEKGVSPDGLAAVLGNVIHVGVLVTLALLALSRGGDAPRRRQSRRWSEAENPFA